MMATACSTGRELLANTPRRRCRDARAIHGDDRGIERDSGLDGRGAGDALREGGLVADAEPDVDGLRLDGHTKWRLTGHGQGARGPVLERAHDDAGISRS